MQVAEIYAELERQADSYEDYVLPTSKLQLVAHDEHGIVLELDHADPQDALVTMGSKRDVPLSRRAMLQIAQWLGLPTNSRLYKRLRFGYDELSKRKAGQHSDRFWPTLMQLVNDHFDTLKTRKLVRMLKDHDGKWYVRAILSDRYRIIPNDQLFLSMAEKIKESKAEIWDARLSEDAFYIYCVAPGISAQVRTDRTFGNDGRWIGDAGDAVNAALMGRNSETGQGGCEICPAVVNKVDGSYFVKHTALSVRHLGKQHVMDRLLSPETIKKQNEVLYRQVNDYIEATFDEDKFQDFVDSLNDATQDELEDPAAAAEAARLVYDLSEERKNSVVKWLMESGDRSRYGLAKAISREAHDDDKISADEALHLERASSDLIEKQTSLKLARAYKSKAELKALKAGAQAAASAEADGSLD